MTFGDSRSNNGGGITSHAAGSSYTSTVKPAGSWNGCLPVEMNNAVYYATDFDFGVGAQSTAGFRSRYATASYATTGGTASSYIGSGGAITGTDNAFNIDTNNLYSSLTDPSNVLLFMGGVNDSSTGPITGKINLQSMLNIGALLDAWRSAGKVVFLSNELPNGVGTVYGETYTVPSGGGSYTVTQVGTYYKDMYVSYLPAPGGTNDGVKLTNVASAPGIGQYSVSSGVYTFSAADAGATVLINYSYLINNRSGNQLIGKIALHNWLQSSASDFVDPASGIDYQIPGALYNRSWIVPVNTWDLIADPTATSSALNLPGTLLDGLHPTISACQILSKAYANALTPRLPSTDYSKLPTSDAELLVTPNGSKTTYTSTDTAPLAKSFKILPITPGTFSIITGTITGTDDGSGNITGTGIASGSTINYTTGAWTLKFSSAPAVNQKIYGSADANTLIYNGSFNPAEGFNALSTLSGCTGTCQSAGNLTSSNNTGLPLGYSVSVDSGTAAQLASGAMKLDFALSTTTGDGYPEMQIKISGTTSTTTSPAITFNQTAFSTLALNQKYRANTVLKVDAGTNGRLYGLTGEQTHIYCTTPANTSFTPVGETSLISNGASTSIYSGAGWSPSGLWEFSDLDLVNGELRLPILTQSCDTTGMTGSPTGVFSEIINADQGKPVSATLHISRASVKPFSY